MNKGGDNYSILQSHSVWGLRGTQTRSLIQDMLFEYILPTRHDVLNTGNKTVSKIKAPDLMELTL